MSHLSRRLTAGLAVSIAASTLALVGCSSNSSTPATTPTGTVSASDMPSTATSAATNGASAATTNPSGSASVQTATVAPSVGAMLQQLATKLGCVQSSVVAPTITLANIGVTGGLECLTTNEHYVIITTKDASQVKAAAKNMADGLQNPTLPYLYKDNWLLVGSTKASPTMTKEVAQVAQTKLGGTITTAG